MLELSGFISLFIQFVTGIIDVIGLYIKVPQNMFIFRDILKIELGVQFVEFIFYVWMVTNFTKIKNITPYRYFDWFITTPIMLISLLAYLDSKSYTNIIDFIKENTSFIGEIILLNMIMLVFGLLGELKYIHYYTAILLGFIPFAYYYKRIYDEKIQSNTSTNISQHHKYVYWFFFGIWTLYGIAALLPYHWKNISYNTLDLFAKNGFGIFLVYLLWTNRIK
jgi:bacteriorhodopsin